MADVADGVSAEFAAVGAAVDEAEDEAGGGDEVVGVELQQGDTNRDDTGDQAT